MNKTVQLGNGYLICDYDGSGMLEVVRDDYLMVLKSDEEAVKWAERDGIKIIPVDDLPEGFPRCYYGWIDTPENRAQIDKYCASCNTAVRHRVLRMEEMDDAEMEIYDG